MAGQHTNIRWHHQTAGIRELSAVIAEAAIAEPLAPYLAAMLEAGFPSVEGAHTAKEYALKLLRLAAEVEHELLVQYLYLSSSLSIEPASDGVSYKRKIAHIAIQEMGHLASVQNLLLLIGGREAIYLQRDLERQTSDLNPLPFALEPMTIGSLAKYATVEKPATVPPNLAAKAAELEALARRDAGVEPHRVGMIYEVLRWVFSDAGDPNGEIHPALKPAFPHLPKVPHLTDHDLQSAAIMDQYEARPEEWGDGFEFEDFILSPAGTLRTRSDARALIDSIARQGEGLPGDSDSHFIEFMDTVAAFEANRISVKMLPKSPSLKVHAGDGKTRITNRYTRLWAEVFNLQYSLLMLTIFHVMVTPRSAEGTEGLREKLATLAVDSGMRRQIRSLSGLMATLPMSGPGTVPAGPPYDLDPKIMASHETKAIVAMHLRLTDRLAKLYARIEASAEFSGRPDDANQIVNLKNEDKIRVDLIKA